MPPPRGGEEVPHPQRPLRCLSPASPLPACGCSEPGCGFSPCQRLSLETLTKVLRVQALNNNSVLLKACFYLILYSQFSLKYICVCA